MTEHGAARRALRERLGLPVDAHPRPASSRRRPLAPIDGIERERVEIDTADGDTIPCILLRPAAPGASVIALHQHNGEFRLGKSEVVGESGSERAGYALGLARAGCTVLAPDLAGFEERRRGWTDDDAADEAFDALARIAAGGSLQAKHGADLAALTTWLLEQPDARPRIGVMGHSLGGQLALFAIAADPRIRAAVISCGLGTIASFVRDGIRHNPAWFVPGLLAAGDVPSVAAAVDGEQRVLALVGEGDRLFPEDGVAEVLAGFREGVLEQRRHPGGHTVPVDAVERAAGLLGGAA